MNRALAHLFCWCSPKHEWQKQFIAISKLLPSHFPSRQPYSSCWLHLAFLLHCGLAGLLFGPRDDARMYRKKKGRGQKKIAATFTHLRMLGNHSNLSWKKEAKNKDRTEWEPELRQRALEDVLPEAELALHFAQGSRSSPLHRNNENTLG